MHVGPCLCVQPVDMPLLDFRFRRLNKILKVKAKFQSWYSGLFNEANTNQEMEKAAA